MNESTISALVEAFQSRVAEEAEPIQAELVDEDEKQEEPEIEMKFSLSNHHSHKLFIALARKQGMRPFRYPRMKRTTVMLRGRASYLNNVFWPQFTRLSGDLDFLLQQITNEVIRTVLRDDGSDPTFVDQK